MAHANAAHRVPVRVVLHGASARAQQETPRSEQITSDAHGQQSKVDCVETLPVKCSCLLDARSKKD
eukprot:1160657-Pelagomonas_calceolata.AAC.5